MPVRYCGVAGRVHYHKETQRNEIFARGHIAKLLYVYRSPIDEIVICGLTTRLS